MPGKHTPFCGGPPFVFTTPNLADTRNATLLLVQGKPIDLEAEAGDGPTYAEMRLRLVHDPVGQAIMFELFIRLFYLFVLGVRADCVSHPRGPNRISSPGRVVHRRCCCFCHCLRELWASPCHARGSVVV